MTTPPFVPEEPADAWPMVHVIRERLAQREEFGDAADDALTPSEWVARIVKHTGRAVSLDPNVYRKELVIVGALALAALESFERHQHG